VIRIGERGAFGSLFFFLWVEPHMATPRENPRVTERRDLAEATEITQIFLAIIAEGPIHSDELTDVIGLEPELIKKSCSRLAEKGMIKFRKDKSQWLSTPRGAGVVMKLNGLLAAEMGKW
jgi:hypothetical protein